MLQVGIFTGYFPYALEASAQRIRALGFNTVQLDLIFKDLDLATEKIDRQTCRKIRDTFRRHNLPVSCISAYTNLVDPNPARRQTNLARLKRIIAYALELGSPYVASETGTYHSESDWLPHPHNKSEEAWEDCRAVMQELVDHAREHGATFVIEPYVNNVVGSVEETLRMFAEIDDPHFGLLMDPTNYFEAHNIDEMDRTINRIFNSLSSRICFAHAKDVKRGASDQGVQMGEVTATEGHSLRGVGMIELPAPGRGTLNYDLYLRRLAKDHPNLPIIIEHVEEDDIPRAKQFLDQKLMTNGV